MRASVELTHSLDHADRPESIETIAFARARRSGLHPVNGYLQSSNEELETSQEELQSTNEELVTLNDELQSRMSDLSTSNDDLHNLLLGVDRAIVIVGLDLRIRRFTHAAEKLLNLLPSDLGRSASQLNSFLGGFGVEAVIADSIKNLAPVERDLQATDGRWYSLRIVPYRTLDLMIRGAVISIIDIDLSKRRTDLSAAVVEYAAEGLAAIQHPLMILDGNRAVIWVNDLYFEAFQLTAQEITRSASLHTVVGEHPPNRITTPHPPTVRENRQSANPSVRNGVGGWDPPDCIATPTGKDAFETDVQRTMRNIAVRAHLKFPALRGKRWSGTN